LEKWWQLFIEIKYLSYNRLKMSVVSSKIFSVKYFRCYCYWEIFFY